MCSKMTPERISLTEKDMKIKKILVVGLSAIISNILLPDTCVGSDDNSINTHLSAIANASSDTYKIIGRKMTVEQRKKFFSITDNIKNSDIKENGLVARVFSWFYFNEVEPSDLSSLQQVEAFDTKRFDVSIHNTMWVVNELLIKMAFCRALRPLGYRVDGERVIDYLFAKDFKANCEGWYPRVLLKKCKSPTNMGQINGEQIKKNLKYFCCDLDYDIGLIFAVEDWCSMQLGCVEISGVANKILKAYKSHLIPVDTLLITNNTWRKDQSLELWSNLETELKNVGKEEFLHKYKIVKLKNPT